MAAPAQAARDDQRDGELKVLIDEAMACTAALRAAKPAGIPLAAATPVDLLNVWTSSHASTAAASFLSHVRNVASRLDVAAAANDDVAEQLKAKGNAAFARRKSPPPPVAGDASPHPIAPDTALDEAVLCYTQAMSFAASDEACATLHNNRSTAYFAKGLTVVSLFDANEAVWLYAAAAISAERQNGAACIRQVDDAERLARSHTLLPPAHIYLKALLRRGACLAQLGYEEDGARDAAAAATVGQLKASPEADAMAAPLSDESLLAATVVVTSRARIRDVLVELRYDPVSREALGGPCGKPCGQDVPTDTVCESLPSTVVPCGRQATMSVAARWHEKVRCAESAAGPEGCLPSCHFHTAIDPAHEVEDVTAATGPAQPPNEHHGLSVVSISSPLAFCGALDAGSYSSCAYCCMVTTALVPCPSSRHAGVRSRGLYCGVRCALAAWEQWGWAESRHAAFFIAAPTDVVLAFRLMLGQAAELAAAVEGPSTAACTARDSFWGPLLGAQMLTRETCRTMTAGGSETAAVALALAMGTADRLFRETNGASDLPSTTTLTPAERALSWLTRFADANITSSGPTVESESVTAFLCRLWRDAMRMVVQRGQSVWHTQRLVSARDPGQTSFTVVSSGKAIYDALCYFRHACDPNCCIAYEGNPHAVTTHLHVRLLRPVAAGEPLTVAFSATNGSQPSLGLIHRAKQHSIRERSRLLTERYGMSMSDFGAIAAAALDDSGKPMPGRPTKSLWCCPCAFCQSPSPDAGGDRSIAAEQQQWYTKAADYYQKGRRLMREGKCQDAIAVLAQSLEIAFQHIKPEPPAMIVATTHDAIAQAHATSGHRQLAASHVIMALDARIRANGDGDPLLYLEYKKLAALLTAADGEATKRVVELVEGEVADEPPHGQSGKAAAAPLPPPVVDSSAMAHPPRASDWVVKAQQRIALQFPPSASRNMELALVAST